MIFAEVAIDDAEGLVLAHSVRTPGRVFGKGIALTPDDVASLRAAGIETVFTVRVEPGDMREDPAAALIANALAGAGVDVSDARTGRCNLHAGRHGVCEIERDAIDALNRANTGVLVSTVVPDDIVGPGRAVATVKVIPYAVNEDIVRAVCGDVIPIHIRPFRPLKAGLILTEVTGAKAGLDKKARTVIAGRLETFTSRLAWTRHVTHRKEAVADAISELHGSGAELILVLGGASASDRADVVPAAIEAATGNDVVFGIPVDPGNLLAAGRIGDVSVIGLPGCARSPRLNGVDLVLPRVLAGMEISAAFLLGLGVGGLLSDLPDRPQPREDHSTPVPDHAGVSKVAAVVLAAGTSRRMGEANKMLADVDGAAMICRVTEAAVHSMARPVTVVTGFEADRVREALEGLDVVFAHNPRFLEGLSASVKAGVRAVPEDVEGAVVVLGDMPRVETIVIDRLVTAFGDSGGQAICVPTHQGKRGNPVLWPREFFPDILDLTGDKGAREILDRHADRIREVAVEEPGVLIDVDTPGDLDDDKGSFAGAGENLR